MKGIVRKRHNTQCTNLPFDVHDILAEFLRLEQRITLFDARRCEIAKRVYWDVRPDLNMEPLTDDDNRFFDSEVRASINYHF